jgi:hypothetical protein
MGGINERLSKICSNPTKREREYAEMDEPVFITASRKQFPYHP